MGEGRLKAAGQDADRLPRVPLNAACTTCPPGCAQKWAEVDAETRAATAAADPIERNRKISAAYAAMNLRQPQMQWIGLAAIVSRQAGCAMEYASERMQSPLPPVSRPAGIAKEALAETNQLIFSDIYPVMRFQERFGAQQLGRCQAERPGGQSVPEPLLKAARTLEAGDPQGASDMIANYEQRDIVQARIYNQERYKDTFEKNEYWSRNALGRYFGARPAEISMSSRCQVGGEIPLAGSIGKADDRVRYYESLIKDFNGRGDGWRTEAMQDIVKQGQ